MKRIDIFYGGEHYSVGGVDFDALQSDIEAIIVRGGGWLLVNDGEGEVREAYLYLSPGVSIAIVPVPERGDAEGEGPWEGGAPSAEFVS
jgi:hypothetical protein